MPWRKCTELLIVGQLAYRYRAFLHLCPPSLPTALPPSIPPSSQKRCVSHGMLSQGKLQSLMRWRRCTELLIVDQPVYRYIVLSFSLPSPPLLPSFPPSSQKPSEEMCHTPGIESHAVEKMYRAIDCRSACLQVQNPPSPHIPCLPQQQQMLVNVDLRLIRLKQVIEKLRPPRGVRSDVLTQSR